MPPQPPRPRRRRGLILGLSLGGFGVLLIAALGIGFAVLSAHYAPSASVSSFLDQVVKGRSAEAVKQMSPAPAGDLSLLQDHVYSATKHRITSYRITSTTVHGDDATVTAELRTDQGSWTQHFALVTERRWLIWRVWTLDGSLLPTITLDDVRPSGVDVTVNGAAIQEDHEDSSVLYALPGRYTFAIETDNSLVAADSHTTQIRRLGDQRNVAVQLRFRLTDDGVAAARSAVDSYLDGCLSQAVLAPVGNCGFFVKNDPTGTVSNISWSLKQRPVVSFDTWQDDGWNVKTDTAGVFEMDGEYRGTEGEGDVSAFFTSYDVEGYVDLEHGQLVFHSTYDDGSGDQPDSGNT
jgi:hypothetical protein